MEAAPGAPPAAPGYQGSTRFALALGLMWFSLFLVHQVGTRHGWGNARAALDWLDAGRWLHERYGIPDTLGVLGAAVVPALALGFAVIAIAWIGRRLRIDLTGESGEALAWSAAVMWRRRWTMLVVAMLVPALDIVNGALVDSLLGGIPENDSYGTLSTLLLSIFLARREVLAGSPDAWRWRIAWPGWPLIGAWLLVNLLLHWQTRAMGWDLPLVWVLLLPLLCVLLWANLLFTGLWVERANAGMTSAEVLRATSRREVFAPFLAQAMRGLGWSILVFLPLTALALSTAFGWMPARAVADAGCCGARDSTMAIMALVTFAANLPMWLAEGTFAILLPLAGFRLWVRMHPLQSTREEAI